MPFAAITTTTTPISTAPAPVASPPTTSETTPHDTDASAPALQSEPAAAAGPPAVLRLCREHPRNSVYLLGLIMAVAGLVAGWIAFLTHERWIEKHGNNAGIDMGLLAVNGVFLICLLVAITALLRQTYYTHLLLRSILHPESYTSSARNRNRTSGSPGRHVVGETSRVLPSWLLPRPPPYGDIVRGTGDVEDQAVYQGEGLPKYGDTRGSRLLLAGIRLSRADSRTSSRGHPTGPGPEQRHSVVEVDGYGDGDSVGVMLSGGETQMITADQEDARPSEPQAEGDTSLQPEKARYAKP